MDGAASSFHALIKLLHWESGWKATLVFYWLRSHLNSTYWLSSLCGRSQKNDIIICEYIPSSSWLCVSYVHRLLYISNWLKWKKKKKKFQESQYESIVSLVDLVTCFPFPLPWLHFLFSQEAEAEERHMSGWGGLGFFSSRLSFSDLNVCREAQL